MIKLGNINAQKVMLGKASVQKVMLGTRQVWTKTYTSVVWSKGVAASLMSGVYFPITATTSDKAYFFAGMVYDSSSQQALRYDKAGVRTTLTNVTQPTYRGAAAGYGDDSVAVGGGRLSWTETYYNNLDTYDKIGVKSTLAPMSYKVGYITATPFVDKGFLIEVGSNILNHYSATGVKQSSISTIISTGRGMCIYNKGVLRSDMQTVEYINSAGVRSTLCTTTYQPYYYNNVVPYREGAAIFNSKGGACYIDAVGVASALPYTSRNDNVETHLSSTNVSVGVIFINQQVSSPFTSVADFYNDAGVKTTLDAMLSSYANKSVAKAENTILIGGGQSTTIVDMITYTLKY